MGARGRKPTQPCGTWARYKRHLKQGETPDEACRAASAKRSRDRYQRVRKGQPIAPPLVDSSKRSRFKPSRQWT